MKEACVFSINYSKTKGITKTPVKNGLLIADYGLENDAHAGGDKLKQVSLLSIESISRQKECAKIKKSGLQLGPGDFAENITTIGIDLSRLKVNDRLRIGNQAIIEISKIGKDCHRYCAIYYKLGSCIMPKEGVFAKVLAGGEIKIRDRIEAISNV